MTADNFISLNLSLAFSHSLLNDDGEISMKTATFFRLIFGSALLGGLFLSQPAAANEVGCPERANPCPSSRPHPGSNRPCLEPDCPPPAAPNCPEPAPCPEAYPQPAPAPTPSHPPAEGHHFIEEYSGSFVCEEYGIPTTMFYAPEGSLPVIRWRSHYFAQSGYTPEVRCRAVSDRFQRFYDRGILNYVTTGIVNRLPVVCVSSELGGPCSGVLYTLRPGQNASQVLQQLFDVSYGQAGPLYESGARLYLDMNEYLGRVQPQQTP